MLKWMISLFCMCGGAAALAQEPSPAPNIVIVIIDDAALMDLGVYGGEARTPHIDSLAQTGAMFTQYRTSPLCSPSRAMLLTGVDNHRTGVSTIPEVLPEEHVGQPGYSLAFEPGVLTLGDRLREAGYRTLLSGKWHIGEHPDEMPQAHGFDRSFALAASGADNWDDKSYMPYYKDAPWFEDGVEVSLPEDFYSSEFIVDKMIEYLDDTDPDKPFLAVLPFQAIHIPVQAPQSFIDNYAGVYDTGWTVLREDRHARAVELGLFPEDAPIASMPEGTRNWSDLSDDEREIYAARMALNAAMLEAMDHHFGRFIQYLQAENAIENTIFVVTSDNGPEYNSGTHDIRLTAWMLLNDYHVELDGLGGPGSWGFIGPEWASAAAAPGSLYKFYATEGGIRAPLIISGPDVAPMRIESPAMVSDIAPTLLDWVNAPPAPSDAEPTTGRSLLPLLRGESESVYGADDVRAIEVSGNSALYKGDYKITRSMPPVGDAKWRLYDMLNDPGETEDLSANHPETLSDMLAEYQTYSEKMGVLEMPEGYDSQVQVGINAIDRMYGHYPWLRPVMGLITLLGLGLIGFVVLSVWRRVRQS
jgi:arylsulfatase/uncharacterized sulfatase